LASIRSISKRTIGRLAAEVGVSVETVRYYERRGLLDRPSGGDGMRVYPERALWRLRYLRIAQSWGFTLKEAAGLLGQAERTPSCASLRAAAAAKREELDRRILELQGQRDSLAEFIDACAAHPADHICPIHANLTSGEPSPRGR
jgi:MerR family mercuric resistance operon transcriptional regulator